MQLIFFSLAKYKLPTKSPARVGLHGCISIIEGVTIIVGVGLLV